MICDGIIFDLDGTLWDSVDEIILTWNHVIEQNGSFRKPIDRAEQESVMGLPMDEIARRLFPGESAQRQAELMEECVQEENAYLEEHGATLYPGVEDTLQALSEKYRLCIVSNCQKGYIEGFLKAHNLKKYISDHLCYGDTLLTKGENNRIMAERNGFQHPVYVGDTQGDLQSAMDAGMPFVFCEYGFGSVSHYDAKVETFSELNGLF